MSGKEKRNCVSIHPDDAKALEVETGETVSVSTETGSIEIEALVTDEVMPGVVSIPHGWGHGLASGLKTAKKYHGVNVNLLLPSGPGTLEKFAGMARMTGVRVSINRS